ncbi:MAG: efflux RND transporter permease subunit [Paracoccaceae bacterium]
MIGAIVSRDARYSTIELGDILDNQIAGPVQRTEGVGRINSFGSGYALRVWLDPLSLAEYQLTPADNRRDLGPEHHRFGRDAGGAAGGRGPAVHRHDHRPEPAVEPGGIRKHPAQDRRVGAQVLLGDVAEVEIGQESYGGDARFNGANAAGFATSPPGPTLWTPPTRSADARRAGGLAARGVEIEYAYDTSPFVELSIEVYHTLAEAIVLVFFVILVFLQKWRAT